MSQNTIGRAVRILWGVVVKSVVGAVSSKGALGRGVGRGG